MFTRFVASPIVLLVLCTSTAAQQVPGPFLGEWATQPDRCHLPHESNLSISERLFGMQPMHGVVLAVRAISELEIEVQLDAANGSGRSTRRYSLTPDRRTLTDLTDRSKPVTRVRCDTAQQRIIGLAEIPALRTQDSNGRDQVATPVTLHVEPKRNSAVAVTIRDMRQLVSRGHGYEEASAVVYSEVSDPVRGTWYRLGYAVGDKVGYAWLDPAAGGIFRSVHTLVYEGMAHMTPDWDRRLHARPEAAATSRAVDPRLAGEHAGAKVLSTWTERATGEDWYLVAIIDGRCGDAPPEVIATGWVRTYAANGGNTVWYYSRGC